MRRWGLVTTLAGLLVVARAVSAEGPSDKVKAVQKLRTFCKACHGLGELRFIHSDNDDDVWSYLFRERAPVSKKLWAQAIYDTLDWPTDEAPAADQMISGAQAWMPRGYKRIQLAKDKIDGEPTRRWLMKVLAP